MKQPGKFKVQFDYFRVNSLFAIPLNQEYVFVEEQSLDVLDTKMLDVNRALKFCLGVVEENTRKNKPPPKNGRAHNYSKRFHNY